jgi:hypothetical protein
MHHYWAVPIPIGVPNLTIEKPTAIFAAVHQCAEPFVIQNAIEAVVLSSQGCMLASSDQARVRPHNW